MYNKDYLVKIKIYSIFYSTQQIQFAAYPLQNEYFTHPIMLLN